MPIRRNLAVACLFAATVAAGPAAHAGKAPPEAIESLMLMDVSGRIVIGADGSVESITTGTKLPPDLQAAVESRVRGWRFAPVRIGAEPRRAETAFGLVLGAVKNEGGYGVRVDGTSFGDPADQSATLPDGVPQPIVPLGMDPPGYPSEMLAQQRTGRVLVAILVSPDGRVEQAKALQSLIFDRDRSHNDPGARGALRDFEQNAVAATRKWTFKVPPSIATLGPEARTVTTTVEYTLRPGTAADGRWLAVRRGPRRAIDWMPASQRDAGPTLGTRGATQVSALASPYTLVQPASGTPVM
jgi:outer membrane biosynthesis protein TonB